MIRLIHIGGLTLMIEVAGLRLLTDPTFDPAGAEIRSARKGRQVLAAANRVPTIDPLTALIPS